MIALADLKTFLGITDTAQDALLTQTVEGVNSWVLSVIGDIGLSEKTITVKCSNVYDSVIWGCHKNIVSITDINGTDFTAKANFTDYIIHDNDTFQVENLNSYLDGIKFGVFQVKYNSGYTTYPNSYLQALYKIAAYEFLKAGTNTGEIKKEKLGPREYEYHPTSDSSGGSGYPPHVQSAIDFLTSTFIPSHLLEYDA